MCNLSQGVLERGIQQGIQQGKDESMLVSIQAIMESLKISTSEAMNLLRIPEKDQAKYAAML